MAAKPRVVMYATATCPYCMAARMLLKKKGVDYEEIAVAGNDALRSEMEQRSGRRTVPQIFIDDKPLGGFDDINELDQRGELDTLLGRSARPANN